MNLQEAYDQFLEHQPPKGFGLIAEDTQMLIDLLDGDIAGLIQQRLAGKNVEEDLTSWKERAAKVNEYINSCTEKLREAALHANLLNQLATQLETDAKS